MSGLVILTLSLLTTAACGATALTKQKLFETFSHENSSSEVVGQDPDILPGPVNALYWENLQSFLQIDHIKQGPLSDVVISDPYYYGGFLDASKPAVITSKYPGSCVKSWTLDSFAFGCNADQMFYDPSSMANYTLKLASNCTVTVEGLDRNGHRVGREVFHYKPYPLNSGEQNNGLPYGFMTLFNTTRGALKGVKFQTVNIGVKVETLKGGIYTYEGGLGAGVDAVTYTVFNRTGCT